MLYLMLTIHVLVCVFLILVVLLQQGKGADLSVFGGGSTQTAFGARGATTFLHKLTVFSFIIFVLTTLGIGILQSKKSSVVPDSATARKPATAPARTPGGKTAPAAPARPGGVPGAATPAPARPAGGPGAATPAPAATAPATTQAPASKAPASKAPATTPAPAPKVPPPAPRPGAPR